MAIETSARVVVADDSAMMRRIISSSLARAGVNVVGSAADGDDDALAEGAFDLVAPGGLHLRLRPDGRNEPIRDEVHRRLADALRPGGYLVIGSTERVSAPRELGLASVSPFIYRKA